MRLVWRAYSVPKLGNERDENEDSFWPKWSGRRLVRPYHFNCTIADGATQTTFSSLWAQILVRSVTKTKFVSKYSLTQGINDAQHSWKEVLAKKKLPWHAEEKVKQGSFATLLILSMWDGDCGDYGRWQVLAFGDSCVFHIRRRKLIKAFPINNPEKFKQSPFLVSSLHNKNEKLFSTYPRNIFRGKWFIGDQFLLMTDALACWFLESYISGRDPIVLMSHIGIDGGYKLEKFSEWVQDLREDKNLRNDDATLIWLTLV